MVSHVPGHLYSSGASLSLYTLAHLHIAHNTVKSDSSDCPSLVGFDGKTCTSVYFDLAHFHTFHTSCFLLHVGHKYLQTCMTCSVSSLKIKALCIFFLKQHDMECESKPAIWFHLETHRNSYLSFGAFNALLSTSFRVGTIICPSQMLSLTWHEMAAVARMGMAVADSKKGLEDGNRSAGWLNRVLVACLGIEPLVAWFVLDLS